MLTGRARPRYRATPGYRVNKAHARIPAPTSRYQANWAFRAVPFGWTREVSTPTRTKQKTQSGHPMIARVTMVSVSRGHAGPGQRAMISSLDTTRSLFSRF